MMLPDDLVLTPAAPGVGSRRARSGKVIMVRLETQRAPRAVRNLIAAPVPDALNQLAIIA